MPASVALQRYLHRHIETGLPACPLRAPRWHHALVVPAYRESATLLERLCELPAGSGRTLLIMVLNRPDSDPDASANAALRTAINQLPAASAAHRLPGTFHLNDHADLYLHDMDARGNPIPADMGVGLARKTGCDLAIHWMNQGAISGNWICSTDADATLPADYFEQLESITDSTAAAVFPFQHIAGATPSIDHATALYELRLHHYVLGLEYANSPYAQHTLGSCLAMKAEAYAQVRGFPKRAGAEDFYLLNKLAKVGPVTKLQGQVILLQSRASDRIPFGTGPAVLSIAAATLPDEEPLFYHPQCFAALRVLLASVPQLAGTPRPEIEDLLIGRGLERKLAQQSRLALEAMDIESALQHCVRQGKSAGQFQRQFHHWFDAFRTLKFIHGLRDAGWPQQSLAGLENLAPSIWPATLDPNTNNSRPQHIAVLREAIRQYWGWRD